MHSKMISGQKLQSIEFLNSHSNELISHFIIDNLMRKFEKITYEPFIELIKNNTHMFIYILLPYIISINSFNAFIYRQWFLEVGHSVLPIWHCCVAYYCSAAIRSSIAVPQSIILLQCRSPFYYCSATVQTNIGVILYKNHLIYKSIYNELGGSLYTIVVRRSSCEEIETRMESNSRLTLIMDSGHCRSMSIRLNVGYTNTIISTE